MSVDPAPDREEGGVHFGPLGEHRGTIEEYHAWLEARLKGLEGGLTAMVGGLAEREGSVAALRVEVEVATARNKRARRRWWLLAALVAAQSLALAAAFYLGARAASEARSEADTIWGGLKSLRTELAGEGEEGRKVVESLRTELGRADAQRREALEGLEERLDAVERQQKVAEFQALLFQKWRESLEEGGLLQHLETVVPDIAPEDRGQRLSPSDRIQPYNRP